MDEYLVRTAKALEIARMRSGLSQQKLAAKMGVNRGTVANWEQGLAAISLPMAMRWFTCCGVSVARYMDACIHPGLLEHLEDDLSDLEEKLNYYIAHPAEAEQIVEHAHEYVSQFFDAGRERLISLLVMDKYFQVTKQTSNC